jgi:hypothetical protein
MPFSHIRPLFHANCASNSSNYVINFTSLPVVHLPQASPFFLMEVPRWALRWQRPPPLLLARAIGKDAAGNLAVVEGRACGLQDLGGRGRRRRRIAEAGVRLSLQDKLVDCGVGSQVVIMRVYVRGRPRRIYTALAGVAVGGMVCSQAFCDPTYARLERIVIFYPEPDEPAGGKGRWCGQQA